MGNVKKRFLKADYINTDKVRGEITQVQQYTNLYNLGDFTSDDDIPNVRAVRDIAGSIVGFYEVAVTAQSSLVIDWQNDLIDGVNTFGAVLGNKLPKPIHYFKSGDNYTDGSVKPDVVRTGGLIITVTFNWGYSADCVIVF